MNTIDTQAQATTATVAVVEKKAPAAKEKKAPAQRKAPAAKASTKGAAFFISANRPASGALLKAHTAAFFTLYNMVKEGAPLAIARAVLGDTAIAYHVKGARFAKREGRLFLTESGALHFGSRADGLDTEAVKAFASVMATGKPDGRFVKAQGAITKIA